ncbi:MAG: glutamate synthase subunit beta [Bacteroidales bacterium]
MGDPRGFMKVGRKVSGNRAVHERLNDYSEVEQTLNEEDRKEQASRCMDCGIPFCQWGCPVMNNMPEWQDAIYKGDWKKAIDLLHVTNNFPEFTGRICPAPCEAACVLAIHEEPVTIRENEAAAAEKGFEHGFIFATPPRTRTGKKIAVVGSGPAGLACADLLNKAGHWVTVFEKDDVPGGLLRYGIPDFKLDKHIVDRRLKILIEEGLEFKTNTHVGVDITPDELVNSYDAVCLTVGAMQPRDLPVEGRDLKGVHFAMDYLTMQNRIIGGRVVNGEPINAKGKHVLVIGGGDTGSDCVGTAKRQGAESVTQIEILPEPPLKRNMDNPWPYWANIKKTTSSHEEGCTRMWNISTRRLTGENGKVKKAEIAEVEWLKGDNGKMVLREIPDTIKTIDADLVLLSMGFVHPVQEGLLNSLSLEYSERGNVKVGKTHQTNREKVFAAGDSISGASLVVSAIMSGRRAAVSIMEYLAVNSNNNYAE